MKLNLTVFTFILICCLCPNTFSQQCEGKSPKVIVVVAPSGPKITHKPQPEYTEQARRNRVSGTVVLRGLFHSSGKVMNVCWVRSLPDGLTENAIKAAYQITFE